ncbi:MAG: hypothetical protein WCP28_18585 [Actinomycetes bacterium]
MVQPLATAQPGDATRRSGAGGHNLTRLWWLLTTAAAGIVGILYFYRGFFFSGFSELQGDSGDGLLTLVVSRHWPLLPGSGLGWNDLGFYYPEPNTLGYSDTLLLNGILEVPQRLLGVDSLVWFQLTMIMVSLIGYCATVAFLRIGPRAPWPIAIATSLVAMFGCGLYFASIHPQLLMFQLLPACALLVLLSQRTVSRRRGWAYGISAGLLFGLITYSAFYVGFLTLLGIAILLLSLCGLTALGRHSWLRLAPVWQRGWTCVIGFALCLPVFLSTYGPAIADGRERSIQEVVANSLEFRQLFRVEHSSLLWGPLIGISASGGDFGEVPTGPAPVLLVASIALLVWGGLRLRQLSNWGTLGMASLITGLVLWLSPARVGDFFPWSQTIYRLPGGAAIRAISRVEVLATPVLAIGIALVLVALLPTIPRSKVTPSMVAVLMVVLGLIVIEEVSLSDRQVLDTALLTDLEQLSAPPPQCQSFALTSTIDPTDVSRFAMVTAASQAAFIAQNTGVPTWNGYSGMTPDKWGLRSVGGSAYRQNALQWGTDHQLLDSACGLDLATRSWLDPNQFNAYLRH